MKKRHTRIRRSLEQWRDVIEELAASGSDRRAFCERKGLRLEALRQAEQRLAAAEVLASPFVELSVPAVAERGSPRRWDIELELGDGVVLRLAKP